MGEERRRRRRERNKVAATKCRNKKKEKTTILVAESEIVEVQNASLKAEVARLDAEKQRLEVITAEALAGLVPARSSIATQATVQTQQTKSVTRRRRWKRWRTTVTSRGPLSPKPKITSTAAERCTTCII